MPAWWRQRELAASYNFRCQCAKCCAAGAADENENEDEDDEEEDDEAEEDPYMLVDASLSGLLCQVTPGYVGPAPTERVRQRETFVDIPFKPQTYPPSLPSL